MTTATLTEGPAVEEKYADKIAKLLRKAETTTPEEAEALVAKAQELMTTYAISEAMIAKATGNSKPEEIIRKVISYTGIYRSALFDIGNAIGVANGCRTMISNVTWSKPHRTDLILIGFQSDVDRAVMLDASVQIQAASAFHRWVKESAELFRFMSNMDKYKEKRDFFMGFASGLSGKLAAANRAARETAAKDEAARAGVDNKAATESVALVLRSRKDQVNDWMDQQYGKTLRSVSRRYSGGSGAGRGEGRIAGRNADTGGSRLGNRKSIGR